MNSVNIKGLEVFFEYESGSAGDRITPPEADGVIVQEVHVNGIDITEMLKPEALAKFEQTILEDIRESYEPRLYRDED